MLRPEPSRPMRDQSGKTRLRHRWNPVGAIVSALGRSPACAVFATLLLIAALVLPASALAGSTRLRDPQVTPTSGHPSTAITFSVTYRDFEGSGPDYVRVIVGGDTYDLARRRSGRQRLEARGQLQPDDASPGRGLAGHLRSPRARQVHVDVRRPDGVDHPEARPDPGSHAQADAQADPEARPHAAIPRPGRIPRRTRRASRAASRRRPTPTDDPTARPRLRPDPVAHRRPGRRPARLRAGRDAVRVARGLALACADARPGHRRRDPRRVRGRRQRQRRPEAPAAPVATAATARPDPATAADRAARGPSPTASARRPGAWWRSSPRSPRRPSSRPAASR